MSDLPWDTAFAVYVLSLVVIYQMYEINKLNSKVSAMDEIMEEHNEERSEMISNYVQEKLHWSKKKKKS
jgi:hypothetical protein